MKPWQIANQISIQFWPTLPMWSISAALI
jgi:hypothetical protein